MLEESYISITRPARIAFRKSFYLENKILFDENQYCEMDFKENSKIIINFINNSFKDFNLGFGALKFKLCVREDNKCAVICCRAFFKKFDLYSKDLLGKYRFENKIINSQTTITIDLMDKINSWRK